jgi:hypothetical protein
VKVLLQGFAFSLLTAITAAAMSADLVGPGRPDVQQLRWRSGVIRIAVSSSFNSQNPSIKADSDVIGAVRRSLDAWAAATDLEFRLEVSDRQSVSPAGPAGDGVSLITIASTPENLQLFAKDPFSESARTRIFYNRRGAITEGDIVLNPLQQFSTDGTYGTFDLETTLTHEIGHLLGLKHSSIAGSIMAEHIGRDSDQYFGPRTITASDAAAIRELYGVDSDDCCGSISGRISGLGRNVKNVSVWIEDSESRLTGQADVAPDGSYRVGGLSEGKYEAFWRSGATFGDLGTVAVDAGGTTTLSKRIPPEKTDLSLDLIGLNMQPGEAAVSLRPGRQYYLCLTGSGFGTLASISFSSKYIHANASTINKADFGMKFDAATVTVTVDPDAPAGAYTVFAERADGAKSALVGALLVTR